MRRFIAVHHARWAGTENAEELYGVVVKFVNRRGAIARGAVTELEGFGLTISPCASRCTRSAAAESGASTRQKVAPS
jgi:hypothetical protein